MLAIPCILLMAVAVVMVLVWHSGVVQRAAFRWWAMRLIQKAMLQKLSELRDQRDDRLVPKRFLESPSERTKNRMADIPWDRMFNHWKRDPNSTPGVWGELVIADPKPQRLHDYLHSDEIAVTYD